MRHWRGFTILELMITLVVLGILTALAAPSFTKMIARNNLSAASNDLVVALLTARSEAVKRECQVTVYSPSVTLAWADGVTKKADGWTAEVVPSIAGCNDQQIVNHEVSSSNVTITPSLSGIDLSAYDINGKNVTYDPEGRAVGITGSSSDFFTLTVDDRDPTTVDPTKVVCLTLFGRPYIPDTPPNTPQSGADCT